MESDLSRKKIRIRIQRWTRFIMFPRPLSLLVNKFAPMDSLSFYFIFLNLESPFSYMEPYLYNQSDPDPLLTNTNTKWSIWTSERRETARQIRLRAWSATLPICIKGGEINVLAITTCYFPGFQARDIYNHENLDASVIIIDALVSCLSLIGFST